MGLSKPDPILIPTREEDSEDDTMDIITSDDSDDDSLTDSIDQSQTTSVIDYWKLYTEDDYKSNVDNTEWKPIKIKSPSEVGEAHSLSMATSIFAMLQIPQSARDMGFTFSETELNVPYTNNGDNIHITNKESEAEHKLALHFIKLALRNTRGKFHIVTFKCGSKVLINQETVHNLDGNSKIFKRFTDNYDLPPNRFDPRESMRIAFLQSERWWIDYKKKNAEEAIKIATVAITILNLFYPGSGLKDSNCNALAIWKKDDRDNYIGMCQVVANLDCFMLVNVASKGKDWPHRSIEYTVATIARDYMRYDFLEPRITDICTIDV